MLASNQPMFVAWGPERTLIYNTPYSEILAAKHPAAMGGDFLEVWHEIRADLEGIVAQAYRGEPVQMDDITLIMKRRGYPEETHFSFFYSPVRDKNGAVAGLFCACNEITAQVMAQRQLRESEARARADAERVQLALDAGAIIGTWFWHLPTDRFTADEQFARSFGLDPELCRAGLGIEQVVETVHPEDKPGLMAAISEAIARGGHYAHQYRVRRQDGQYHWIEANGRVDHAPDGTALSFPGVLIDIEGRRAAEAAVRESEALLSAVLDALPVGVIIADADGRLVRENAAHRELWGVVPEASSWMQYGEWVGYWPETGERIKGEEWAMTRALLKGEVIHGELVQNERFGTGERRFYLNSAAPVRDAGGQLLGGVVCEHDVTEQREMQERLREAEERLRLAQEASGVGTYDWNPVSGELRWSAECKAMFGLAADADVTHDLFLSLVHPEDRDLLLDAIGRAMDPTGKGIFCLEYRTLWPDRTVRWISARGRASFGEVNGRRCCVRFIGTVIDITDRKAVQAELAAALEMKEALLYEVNHRVKNNLQVVTGLLTIQASQSKNPEVKRDLADARARIGVVAAIHQSLYTSASHNEVEMRSFIRTLAENTLYSLSAGERVGLCFTGEDEVVLPLQQAVPLALIASELLTNAVKYAFPEDRRGTIEVAVELDGEALRVVVADDGVGLPQAFDFAKPSGVGTRVIGVLAKQLRATLDMVPRERGAAFCVKVPLR